MVYVCAYDLLSHGNHQNWPINEASQSHSLRQQITRGTDLPTYLPFSSFSFQSLEWKEREEMRRVKGRGEKV